jgi:hypothetical protein
MMAGPFARLRRGEGAQPEPGAPTDIADPATAEAPPSPIADAPAPDAAATAAPDATAPADAVAADHLPGEPTPGFVERGRLRRRLRYVRRAREVALRDLGGLVFDLHRFGRERTDLVEQKLTALSTLDGEMRTLETALDERREITVLHEPGLASCPRCGALHASDAAYCSACGLPVGRGASLPTGPSLTGSVGRPAATGDGGDTLLIAPGTSAPAPVSALTAEHRPSADERTVPPAGAVGTADAPVTASAAQAGDAPVSTRPDDDAPSASAAPDEQPTTTS